MKTLTGLFPQEAYQDMGFTKAEIEKIRELRKERARRSDYRLFRQLFKRELYTTLVNNLWRCGVLTETMRPRLESIGIRVGEYLPSG